MDGDELDRQLDHINERFFERLSGATRFSLSACYRIIDPSTASQIELAAQCAHWGEDHWAEGARARAGYGGLNA